MRIFSNNEWFEAVSSRGQFEHDFEGLILQHAQVIFPDYHTASFKVPVETEYDRRIPDLALIDRSYRHWWVVEVEMAHHSLTGHVLPQIETFTRGIYRDERSLHLLNHCPTLDPPSIRDMVKGSPPRVLVIANQDVPEWKEPIHRVGGLLIVLEVFRSARNQHLFRLNGDNLVGLSDHILSACRLDPVIPRFLQIDSPASLGIKLGQGVSIFFNDGITDWERFDAADQVWLTPIRNNPLTVQQEYHLIVDRQGRLRFEEA